MASDVSPVAMFQSFSLPRNINRHFGVISKTVRLQKYASELNLQIIRRKQEIDVDC